MNDLALDLPALRCLTVLIGERSVTRTAEKLGLSQPAVSHILARLRRHFGDALLVRSADGMVPTARALELAGDARGIVAAVDRLGRDRAFDPATDRSRFVLTIPEYFERLLAPPLVARLQAEAPGVSIELRAPSPALVRTWLDSGEVDFRLAWIHEPRPESRFARLPEDRLVCLVREGHPTVGERLRAGHFFELAHVRPAIAVDPDADPTAVTVEQYLGLGHRRRAGDRTIRVALQAQSFLTIPHVIANSDMIATVPELATRGLDPELALRVMRPPIALPPLRGALYWHERSNADPRHRWFRRLLLEVARPLQAIH
jgi:DNA-binding transcriptional LysR family regulator